MRTRNLELRRRLGMTLYGKPLTRRPRIGIYGGQFDPIHYGHLSAAHITRIRQRLDQVLFVTCSESPNDKPDSLPAEARHAMVVAATAANPFFVASRIDMRRKGTSYMINTVEAVIEEYGEDADLFAMISSEYLNPDHKHTLSKWIGAKELFAIKQLTFSVFPRDMTEVEQIKEWAKLIPQARIEILDVPSLPLSSTMIRQWVSQGRSIWYTTPWNVQQMIYKNGYYLKPGQAAYKHESPPLAEVRRVGIFPGAFDPITYGDLLKAEWARQEQNLDRVDFVTSGQLPNKRTVHASAENRGDWVVAATADNPYFNARSTDVESGRVSYTLQTVEDAQRRYGKDVELFVLIRADYLNPSHPETLSKWMGAEQLFKMCRFIAFPRDWTQIEKAQQWAKRIPNAKIDVVYAPSIPVESDFVRTLVEQGHSTLYCTPWDVQQLITKSGSYGADKVKRRRSK